MSVEKFTFAEAEDQCEKLGAQLATTGQLYLAWKAGMDVCNAGWLADRSVRYPINIARPSVVGGFWECERFTCFQIRLVIHTQTPAMMQSVMQVSTENVIHIWAFLYFVC